MSCREGEPAVCIAVVDHNICYCANAVSFEFGNQTSEFSLSSECLGVLVEIIIWLIAHYLSSFEAFTAL